MALRLNDAGDPGGPVAVHVRIAVPFSGGTVLAADGSARIVKTPWGLLTAVGDGAAAALAEAERRFRRLPPLGLAYVHGELEHARSAALQLRGSQPAMGGRPDLSWLFSHEVDPLRTDDPTCADPRAPSAAAGVAGWLGAPVSIYRDAGSGPVVSRWGAVLVSGAGGGSAATGLSRDAELHVHAGLDSGVDLNSRLRLAVVTVAWVLREVDGGWVESGGAPLGSDAVIGIHEGGHTYSVDRVSLSGAVLDLPVYRTCRESLKECDGGGDPPPPSG